MKAKIITLGILCLSLFAIGGLYTLSKKKKPKEEPISYIPRTWNDFDEGARLNMLLKGFAIQTVIDLPCKEFPLFAEQGFPIKKYLGIASTEDEAKGLQAQYGSSLYSFAYANLTTDLLPQADLIIAWDQLCTYTPTQVQAALLQMKKSGAKFLLMRHFPEVKENKKNKTGGFQPVNWKLPPYNFPEPIIHIMETKEKGTESLSLWALESL